ncbi:hypothetical protein ACE193_21445 [Bernardetia sp. OM2101]|uniref:hypothetical protein n=1 Tax=Bernardetia sp. OM2101 TaxID=3344876 RepID=UPI0035D0C6CC
MIFLTILLFLNMTICKETYKFITIDGQVATINLYENKYLENYTYSFYCRIPFSLFRSCYKINDNQFLLKNDEKIKSYFFLVDSISLNLIRENRIDFFESNQTGKIYFRSKLTYVDINILENTIDMSNVYPDKDNSTVVEARERTFFREDGSVLLLHYRISPIIENDSIYQWEKMDKLDGFYFDNQEDFLIFYNEYN